MTFIALGFCATSHPGYTESVLGNLPSNPARQALVFPFYRWENRSTKLGSNFSKVHGSLWQSQYSNPGPPDDRALNQLHFTVSRA